MIPTGQLRMKRLLPIILSLLIIGGISLQALASGQRPGVRTSSSFKPTIKPPGRSAQAATAMLTRRTWTVFSAKARI
jgi:hypothetical protein